MRGSQELPTPVSWPQVAKRALLPLSLPCPAWSLNYGRPLLTTAVMVPTAPGVRDLGAVGEDAPAVAGAPVALERHIVAILIAPRAERARVDSRDVADLFLALG